MRIINPPSDIMFSLHPRITSWELNPPVSSVSHWTRILLKNVTNLLQRFIRKPSGIVVHPRAQTDEGVNCPFMETGSYYLKGNTVLWPCVRRLSDMASDIHIHIFTRMKHSVMALCTPCVCYDVRHSLKVCFA